MIVTPDRGDLAKKREALEVLQAQRHLLPYILRMFPEFEPEAMHVFLCEIMELVDAKLLPRLLVEMPPQHGKSEIVTRRFGAWHLGRYPTKDIISVSYADGLAFKFSREVRDQLRDPKWPFPHVRPAHGNFAANQWAVSPGGTYMAAGRGSGITGNPADHLNIDDPFANEEEYRSKVTRDSVWHLYTRAASNRLRKDGTICVTQTRWGDDDLIGRLKINAQQGGRQWACVTLPGLSDSGLVYAKLTLPDDVAKHAGITAADDGEISCEEVIGRLKACLGEAK